ncbi:MAG: hypothetical protein KR126chlam3_01440 [Chlamydiae bacterium]|nr:hypothetical protein [Chlamydiota bacterium]
MNGLNPAFREAVQSLEKTLPEIHAFLAPFKSSEDIYHFANAVLAIDRVFRKNCTVSKKISTFIPTALKSYSGQMEMQALALLEAVDQCVSGSEDFTLFNNAHTILTGWLTASAKI